MLEPKVGLGMTRRFRRKLVLIGLMAWLGAVIGVVFLPENPFLLIPASASYICWLFLLSYALYNVGLFKRHPDERQREVRNRVYGAAYGLTMAVLLVTVFALSRVSGTSFITRGDAILVALVLVEFLLVFPIALAAWLEPNPAIEDFALSHD